MLPNHDEKVNEGIVIVDFGSQYSHLIARRIRELKVDCRIVPWNTPVETILDMEPRGIVLSGGPGSAGQKGSPEIDERLFESGIPVLGICYGMQLMVHSIGGKILNGIKGEYGRMHLKILDDSDIFAEVGQDINVWVSHGDEIIEPHAEFVVTSRTSSGVIGSIRNKNKPLYGVQFHPEVAHTDMGKKILSNFVFKICNARVTWEPDVFISQSIEAIKEKVDKGKAICATSGGVDSSTAALLAHKALGDRLVCIFVNNGLMRKGECEQIVKTFREEFDVNLLYIDAEERFLSRLKGVTDPEEKRNRIGNEFIRVFEEEAKKIGDARFLVQGTVYPDVIESGSTGNSSARIKSHHNVGGLPDKMDLELIEPFRLLFKDEVRDVGQELGMPGEMVWRHPFPGPGLAVRVLGKVTKDRLDLLRKADVIVQDEIKKAGLYNELWQVFAILPGLKSVGVMGDNRTYSELVAIRAVESRDGMTSQWAHLPYEVLDRISSNIVNKVKGINRVVYDITNKPPSTIEWE